jgi:hypothetical protein
MNSRDIASWQEQRPNQCEVPNTPDEGVNQSQAHVATAAVRLGELLRLQLFQHPLRQHAHAPASARPLLGQPPELTCRQHGCALSEPLGRLPSAGWLRTRAHHTTNVSHTTRWRSLRRPQTLFRTYSCPMLWRIAAPSCRTPCRPSSSGASS